MTTILEQYDHAVTNEKNLVQILDQFAPTATLSLSVSSILTNIKPTNPSCCRPKQSKYETVTPTFSDARAVVGKLLRPSNNADTTDAKD